jgi:hypothetical protein
LGIENPDTSSDEAYIELLNLENKSFNLLKTSSLVCCSKIIPNWNL